MIVNVSGTELIASTVLHDDVLWFKLDENTWDFTRIAKIPDITKDELLEAFGDGNVSVTFSIEWRE